MPYEIRPIGSDPATKPSVQYSGSWDWISKQPFDRDVTAWHTSGYRPGSIGGGPAASQLDLITDPNKYRIFAPAPPITERAKTQKAFGRFGTVTMDMIDPFMTLQAVAEGFGADQQTANDVAAAPATFLGERDIDPFGQGAMGVPARLFDYATGWLGAVYDQATGKPIVAPVPQGPGALKFRFQNDPAYWALVTAPNATDEYLAGVAKELAGQFVSGDNRYLADQLAAQFKIDRDQMLGYSTGDRRLDYQAKLAYTVDYVNDRTKQPLVAPPGGFKKGDPRVQPYSHLLGRAPMSQEANTVALMVLPSAVAGAIPFVGADIREAAYQHPAKIEAAWKALTSEQRQMYLSRAGIQMLVGDVVVWLPMLSGLGAVEAVATRSGGLALKAWKTYEYARNVTTATMATGVVVATANWAAQAAVPGWAEGLGKRIDYARPWSQSSLAGLINQMGFFASGTFGAYTAAQALPRIVGSAGRGVGAVVGKVAPKLQPPRLIGTRELSYFKNYHGGTAIRDELAQVDLPDVGILDLAPRQSFVSRLLNYIETDRRTSWEAYVRGHPIGIKELDDLPPGVEREAAANAALLRAIEQSSVEAEGIAKAMLEARRPRPLFSGAEQRAHDVAVKTARFIDDEMARVAIEEYGPGWLGRLAGEYSVPALSAYARKAVTRLGGNEAKLDSHDIEGWSQIVRYLHDYEYARNSGLLVDRAKGAEEAAKVMLVQANHLFANDVDDLLSRIRGDAIDADVAQARVAEAIRTKREAAVWFASEWTPPVGVAKLPENVPPAEFAEWLDDIRAALPSRRTVPAPGGPTSDLPLNAFQVELEKDGLWSLAFKPTDDAGNAISYVRRRNGAVFKSPWVEYPLGNAEAIDMGNRALVASKIDGITRGFRTWRIVEFQKALLYRRLTTRLDVSVEQIERFHAGLMRMAREMGTQPQTIGAVARAIAPIWGKELVQEKVDKLVGDVFGKGTGYVGGVARHLDKKGKPVNWANEIAKSYRQAFRLNLTAGLTSFLKANLGEVGSQIAWASDIGYVMWRFNLSPVFKGGELLESGMFNAMRGVHGIDPLTRSLYLHAGVGNDYGMFAQELPFDPLVQGAAGQRPTYVHADPSARFAAAAAFYARHIGTDFETAARKAFEQTAAAEMRSFHGGGQIPSAGWLERTIPGRVVDPDNIPEGFVTELGDIRPDLLNPDMLAADQGLYHATPVLSKVYAEGIKARAEIGSGTAPLRNEDFLAWRKRVGPVDSSKAPDPFDPLFVHLTEAEYAKGMSQVNKGGSTETAFKREPGTHLGFGASKSATSKEQRAFDTTTDPDLVVPQAPGGYLIQLDPRYANTFAGADPSKPWFHTNAFGPDARLRVWKWNPGKADYEEVYVSAYANVATATQSLGGGSGRRVSTTYLHEHAMEIARRLAFASRAARNEVTNREILEHFADLYGDDFYTMGKVLGASPLSVTDNLAGGAKVLKLSGKKVVKAQPMPGAIDDIDALANWMDTRGKYITGQNRYRAVQDLDLGLQQKGYNDEFAGAVILAAGWEDIAKIDPDDVGVVQLAARKGVRPGNGADDFELEFMSDDLLVIDDRRPLDPLADDEEGLLKQLHATLADQPKEGQMTIGDYMVGGNGFAPGMEDRARKIITKLEDLRASKLDGGPTFKWANQGAEEQAAFRDRLKGEGWKPYAGKGRWDLNDPWERTRLDGTTEVREASDLFDEYQRRPGAGASMDEVAGTPEALFAAFENMAEQGAKEPGWRGSAWDTFWHPAKWKLERATELQIKLARTEFPSLLRISGNQNVEQVFRSLPGSVFKGGVNREDRWLDWLIEDRMLEEKWLASQSQADFDALMAHAGEDAAGRAAFQELYASGEWASLSALINANLKTAGQEAFGVHFFSAYRSPLERSLNHPLLGLYPLSWSIKAAREWIRFLYNNKTLGIDIGMAPAQVIAQTVHAQHAAFAQSSDQSLDEWLEEGPLGSALFIFNLLMPGDWSAIPFALSRTVRDYARPLLSGSGLPDAGEVFANNLRTFGLTRDARLFFESIGQAGDIMFDWLGVLEDPEHRTRRGYSVSGDYGTYQPGLR